MSGDAAAERAYRAALARHGVRDVQPLYRSLLVRLKKADPDAYETAVARYTERVADRIASGGPDPLAVWIEYGIWLAERVHAGRTMAVDDTGLAEPVEGAPSPGPLLLHLPRERGAKAIALAVPEEPTEPQRAAIELLCG